MHNLSCIIIEDEPLAAKLLAGYISKVPSLSLLGSFTNAVAGEAFCRQHQVDCIFLDIHLPYRNGLDFLRSLPAPPQVIITSAYPEYAIDGFNLSVADYLLKPFSFDRLLAAVKKLRNHGAEAAHLFITVQKKKVRIGFDDIIYIESQREYAKIVTKKDTWLTKISTIHIESLLPKEKFVRVHRSFIINKTTITAYSADTIEIGQISIPVGRMFRHILPGL